MLTTSINFDDLSAKAARKSWPAFCVVAVLLVCVVASLDVKVPGYIPVQGFYFAPIYLAIWYCEGFVAFLVVCIAAIAHFYVVSRGIADQVLPWQYIVAYLSTSIVFLGFVALVYFFKLLFYRLQTESRTDALIGLKSRRGFLESAEFEIARAARYRQPLVLAMIDLDDFKSINDSRGHAAGDAALFSVAECITESVRDVDISGRVGGDEFAILLPGVDANEATNILHRLHTCLGSKLNRDGGASIGAVAVSSGSDISLPDLLSKADAVMYRVKKTSKNRVVVESLT